MFDRFLPTGREKKIGETLRVALRMDVYMVLQQCLNLNDRSVVCSLKLKLYKYERKRRQNASDGNTHAQRFAQTP